jgi:NAD(P)-dependent dehydrogenase (short-subunit alcohol dehydrogenase family)
MVGKRAIVVGGGQLPGQGYGNGRAAAVLLAREGAEVFVVDLHGERAADTAAEINAAGGVGHAHAADVANAGACADLVGAAQAAMGGVDVVINNVGIAPDPHDGVTTSEEEWDLVMTTNLRSTWLVSRSAIVVMRQQGTSGAIVNVSSIGAIGSGKGLAYGVSKAAVNALTLRLARENAAHQIRVNAVMPGAIDTPLGVESRVERGEGTWDQVVERRGSTVPMGRMGSAWEVASSILFLCSDASSFTTGALLPVDGGAHTLLAFQAPSVDPRPA